MIINKNKYESWECFQKEITLENLIESLEIAFDLVILYKEAVVSGGSE